MENLGDVLQTSGYLLDQYLDAADVVVEKVFARDQPLPEQTWHFQGDFRTKSKSEKKRNEYDNRHLLAFLVPDPFSPIDVTQKLYIDEALVVIGEVVLRN